VQYYFLWAMIAQVTGYKMGKMTHVVNNLHIYDRHLIIAKDLLNSPTFPSPKISLNSNIQDFYSFSIDDFIVEDYKWGKEIKDIPIAE
jgi:thymidylate synthase